MVKPLIYIARENLEQLVDFVVTEEIVSDLETSLDDFKVLIGQPRVIRNQAFAAMDKLDELFDATNKLLKEKLDKIMIRFEYSDTEFYPGIHPRKDYCWLKHQNGQNDRNRLVGY